MWACGVHDWPVLCQQCAMKRGKRGMEAKRNLRLVCFTTVLFISVSPVLFSAEKSHSLPDLFLEAKQASGFNLWGLYYQKRMFSGGLPVTYSPLQAVHACGTCSVVLIKDYSLVFLIKGKVSRRMRKKKKKQRWGGSY